MEDSKKPLTEELQRVYISHQKSGSAAKWKLGELRWSASEIKEFISKIDMNDIPELRDDQEEFDEIVKNIEFAANEAVHSAVQDVNAANLKRHTSDFESKLAHSLIVLVMPGDASDELWGDLLEIIHVKQISGELHSNTRRWLWTQILREIWPVLKWRIERAVSAVLKVITFSKAIEWLFSKF